MRRPVVIGAGPAGLAAAWSLVGAGEEPLILEAAGSVGGLSASFDLEGFRADYGPHRLHRAASPEVMELYRLATGGVGLGDRVRSGVVHLEGRRLPFPLSLAGLWRGLGPWGAAAYGLSALLARIAPPAADDYAGEAGRRLGRRASARLYEPAARKVWGLDPAELDAVLARARISTDGPAKLLRAATGKGRSRRFFYPEEGSGALAEGLAERIRERGGEIRTGCPVTDLEIVDGRVSKVITDGGEVETDAVVATAPLPALCRWTGGPPPDLSYRALVLLYLVLGIDRVSDHDVHYFADEALPANRLFEAKGFSGGRGPGGRTLIGFDLPCVQGDAIWIASAEELIGRVRPALDLAGAGAAPILAAEVRRIPAAYPILRKGHASERDRALDSLARVEGLYPVGRHALFVHDNVHHACAAGLAAGRAAAARAGAKAWRRAQEPFLFAQIED